MCLGRCPWSAQGASEAAWGRALARFGGPSRPAHGAPSGGWVAEERHGYGLRRNRASPQGTQPAERKGGGVRGWLVSGGSRLRGRAGANGPPDAGIQALPWTPQGRGRPSGLSRGPAGGCARRRTCGVCAGLSRSLGDPCAPASESRGGAHGRVVPGRAAEALGQLAGHLCACRSDVGAAVHGTLAPPGGQGLPHAPGGARTVSGVDGRQQGHRPATPKPRPAGQRWAGPSGPRPEVWPSSRPRARGLFTETRSKDKHPGRGHARRPAASQRPFQALGVRWGGTGLVLLQGCPWGPVHPVHRARSGRTAEGLTAWLLPPSARLRLPVRPAVAGASDARSGPGPGLWAAWGSSRPSQKGRPRLVSVGPPGRPGD